MQQSDQDAISSVANNILTWFVVVGKIFGVWFKFLILERCYGSVW